MEEKLQELLQEGGDRLLWSGRPETFKTLDKTNRASILRYATVTAIVMLSMTIGYVLMADSVSIWVVLLLLAFGVRVAADRWLTANMLRKDCLYAATDKRLILVSRRESRAVEYDRIPLAAFGCDGDGHISLLCGMTAQKRPVHWRSAAIVLHDPIDPESKLCDDFVFYALKEPEKLKTAVKDYLTIN